MKYAVAYLRVSTEEQTVENQRLALNRYAADNGFQILDFFEDPAVSGKISAVERKGFKQLLEFIKTEKVDAVLVYELSRVGRVFWETLDAIKLVDRYSAIVSCSPKEAFLQVMEPSVRKLMIGILTWVAERERDVLVQRTKEGMERAKAQGKHIGRKRYQFDEQELTRLLLRGDTRGRIAKYFGVSRGTLYVKLHEMRMTELELDAIDTSRMRARNDQN